MTQMVSPAVAIIAGALLISVGASSIANAQQGVPDDVLPFDRIRMIVPLSAGGGTDRSARQFQPHFAEHLGRSVVVEPTPGGGTALGTATAVRDGADCSTVLFGPIPHIQIAYLTQRDVGYTGKDLVALGQMYNEPAIIAVFGNAAWETLEDLVEDARNRPGQIRFAVSSINSNFYLGLLEFERAADIDLNLVTYQGGGPARVAVRSGEVDGIHVSLFAIAPELDEWRVLGVDSAKVEFPEVSQGASTVTEQLAKMGHDDHHAAMEARIGVFVSARCQSDHPERFAAVRDAAEAALNDPKLAETIKAAGEDHKAGRTLGSADHQAIFDEYIERLTVEIDRAPDLELVAQ